MMPGVVVTVVVGVARRIGRDGSGIGVRLSYCTTKRSARFVAAEIRNHHLSPNFDGSESAPFLSIDTIVSS